MDTKKAIEILHALVVRGPLEGPLRFVSSEVEVDEFGLCDSNHTTGFAVEDNFLLKTINFGFNLDALGCIKFKFCPDCGVEL
tara:strand:+ start:2068 stop:2313 length:246 start_codon:yes stop_codon:yes gene_type:complete